MSKNCIIVPTHPKDFHWTKKLLDSATEEENIAIVFSSAEDAAEFKHSFTYLEIIAPPVPKNIPISTHKKLSALKQLQDQFEYIAIIDTEAVFIQPITPVLKAIWDNNCLVANSSFCGIKIMEKCLKSCDITNYPYDHSLYYWFNEIQVYPNNYISEFFQWLTTKPNALIDNAFEYLLFGIFLITEKNHTLRILDGECAFGSIECLGHKDYTYQRHLAAQVHWCPWFPGVENYKNIRMLFHLDRYDLPDHLK